MSQIEVTKLNGYYLIGQDDDSATVAKLNMYIVVAPGDGGGDLPRQAHVYAQKIVRD